jgi:hypothetical protein
MQNAYIIIRALMLGWQGVNVNNCDGQDAEAAICGRVCISIPGRET